MKINVFISICNHHYYKGNKLPQQSLYDPFFSYQFEDGTFEKIFMISKFVFRFSRILGSGGLWSFQLGGTKLDRAGPTNHCAQFQIILVILTIKFTEKKIIFRQLKLNF